MDKGTYCEVYVMDYWSYERSVTSSGVWIRKAIPWEEKKPSKRHSDRKITHVYECLVNTKHKEYYSDHTLTNIWFKSCAIVIVSPLITVMQTIYHLFGFGLIKQIFANKGKSEGLSSRCIKELKKIYLVPFYGVCQTILALGIVLCSPFNSEIAYKLRWRIGRVQQYSEAEKYFTSTFEPIFQDEVKEKKISNLITDVLQQDNQLFRRILKVPCYKSRTHTKFVDQDKGHAENQVEYYCQSHDELFRLNRKDHRTINLKRSLMQKINASYKKLEQHKVPPTPSRVAFDLEKNEVKPISKKSTYKLVKRYKSKLRRSHTKFNTRKKRFLAHSLDEIYQGTLGKYAKELVKNNYDSPTIKKIGKMLRKKHSSSLKNFQNVCEENEKFLPNLKITTATRKLRQIIRSSTFAEIVKNDFLLFEKERNFYFSLNK